MRKHRTRVFYLVWSLWLLAFLGLGMLVSGEITEDQAHITPNYKEENLEAFFRARAASAPYNGQPMDGEANTQGHKRESWTPEDYDLIYRQTGLSRSATEKLLQEANGEKRLLEFQETFFTSPHIRCVQGSWVCRGEQTVDEEGEIIRAWEVTGIEEGDIIVTKSSHVLGWRNGHAALVIDAEPGKTLEAVVIGENTAVRKIKKWEKYPNGVVLRLAGVDKEARAEVARWAEENLLDVPYRLMSGFWGGKEDLQEVTGTQCAHLIWRAYTQFGYDLDSDGGWVVTPKNLVNSPLLEVVQIYGMNPDNPWP